MVDASPYARKVRVLAIERGVFDRVEPVTANPHERPAALVAANPLSKVPTLVADDGSVHIDSLAICMYLDTLGDAAPLVPLSGAGRWPVMHRHALAHGIMDCSVTRRMESLLTPEPDRLKWMDKQFQTTVRTLDWFEEEIDGFGGDLAIDTITLGCALSYVDFRLASDDWRTNRPKLAAWHAAFEKRPSMEQTKFS
jgi:glutathione S-transferase